ncbi:sensor histidine kinase [Candidatus Nitrospira bockiana]
MWRTFSLRKFLFSLLGLGLTLLLLVVVAAFWTIIQERASREWIDHTRDVLEAADDIWVRIAEAERLSRSYLLTADEAYVHPLEHAVALIPEQVARLRTLMADHADQQLRLDALEWLLAKRLGEVRDDVTVRRLGRAQEAIGIVQSDFGRSVLEDIRGVVESIKQEERRLLALRKEQEREYFNHLLMALVVGSGVAFVLIIGASRQIARYAAAQRRSQQEIGRLLTEAEQREQDLRAKQEQLIQAGKLASIGQLASGIAHELNNPLNNIGLYIGNVLDRLPAMPTGQPFRDQLRRAQQQVEKAAAIIDQLRVFSRQASTGHTAVCLHGTIERALALVHDQMRVADIAVDLHLAPCSPTIKGNGLKLEQVFINLLTNARDAMQTSAMKRLTVATSVRDTAVTITVQDTGCGMSAEVLSRVFDPFFTTKEVGKGTGLGLSIAYGIVQEHQGRITATSVVGQGTTFTIQLPLLSVETPDAPVFPAEAALDGAVSHTPTPT